jgi:hypothetical protein
MACPHAAGRFNKVVTNKVFVHLAGRGPVHRARARVAALGARLLGPLIAFRTGDTVTFALTYGPRVDWLRNVRAAGGGRTRIGREIVTLDAPVDLSPYVGMVRMPAPARVVLRLTRVERFVEMPVLSAVDAR